MPNLMNRLRPALEPLVGGVFLLLWINAEVGRFHEVGFYLVLSAYAIAIGAARALPWVSLAILFFVPVVEFIGLLERPDSTTWPIAGASIIVAFIIALNARPLIKWVGLAVVLAQALFVGFLLVYAGDWIGWTGGAGVIVDESSRTSYAIFLSVIGAVLCGTAWTAGFAISVSARRRQQQEILSQTEAELTVAGYELRSVTERTGIAQEVHDVLAHSLAVVIAVADGARFIRESKPETTDEALREIANTARSALLDLRSLIEGLRDDTANRPQPGIADLPALTDRLSAAGMTVETEVFGRPHPLTASQELVVYRIVQESLTNALKHSGARPSAVVGFDWQGSGLALSVTSTGDHPQADLGEGQAPHYGVQGMKDRAHLAGGWLTAGLDDGADPAYLVTAYIPTAALPETVTEENPDSASAPHEVAA